MVVPTHTGIQNFANSLLEWRRDQREQFKVVGGDPQLHPLVERAFLNRRHGDPPLRAFAGSLDDLDDLFRAIVWELMIDGRTCLIARWHNVDDLPPPAKLPIFRIVQPAALRHRRGKVIAARLPKGWPSGEVEESTIDDGDVLEMRWPLPGVRPGGISPVDRAVAHHLRWNELMDASLAVSRAQVETEDRSLRAERARWMSLAQITDELKEVNLKIQAELYELVSDRPMTKFFDAYQVLNLLHRKAVVREYLVGRFNHFVQRFSSIARADLQAARLELVDYPSAAAVEQAIQAYTAQEITAEEAIQMSKPKK